MNRDLLTAARDALPPRLNCGILMGDGGFCILGHMLAIAGHHPILVYGSTHTVLDPAFGGNVVDVVAREYDIDRDVVLELARVNDTTASDARVGAVRALLDEQLNARP